MGVANAGGARGPPCTIRATCMNASALHIVETPSRSRMVLGAREVLVGPITHKFSQLISECLQDASQRRNEKDDEVRVRENKRTEVSGCISIRESSVE